MGWLRPVFSVFGGAIERIFIEIYDPAQTRVASPVGILAGFPDIMGLTVWGVGGGTTESGMDDILEEPFLPNADGTGVGTFDRRGTVFDLRGKIAYSQDEAIVQDQTGNDPNVKAVVTFFQDDLIQQGLWAAGICKIKVNDRLIKVVRDDGPGAGTRLDFTHHRRKGLFCTEVREASTGTRTFTAVFENRQVRALSG